MTVEPGTDLLDQVRALGRKNARTLGFFPNGAFEDYASRGSVIAIVEDGQVRGYAIFRMRHLTIVLVHLCVAEEARGRGYARALVEYIASRAQGFAGIQANCRADFPADAVWPKLGFTVRNEIRGRAIEKPTILKVWWRDLDLPDLFSSVPSKRPVAAIDVNILIDLDDQEPRPQQEESQALLADWLGNVVELAVTDEVFTEIARNPRTAERQRRLRMASAFKTIPAAPQPELDRVLGELEGVLGPTRSRRAASDRRHLAMCILGGAHYFITRDEEMLAARVAIEEGWGICVLRPCDLISQTDAELSGRSFAPARLSGSGLTTRRLRSEDVETVARLFRASAQGEGRGVLLGTLRRALARPDSSAARIVTDELNRPIGLLVTVSTRNALEVPALRTAGGRVADVLARHLVWLGVREAVLAGKQLTRVSDPCLSAAAEGVLADLGFRREEVGVAKINATTRTALELAAFLESLSIGGALGQEWLEPALKVLRSQASAPPLPLAAELEKAFWPAKLLDSEIRSYIVPILPEWAAQLFHEDLASQSLFASDPALMLRLDNVYYRSAKPPGLVAPSRVLWYVTASKEKPSSKCIVAASMVYEVLIDSAKSLYARFRRYGVYQWSDVLRIAKGNPSQQVMAFRFGHTELFGRAVPLQRVRELVARAGIGHLVLQSPFPINSNAFDSIYSEGMRHNQ